MRKTFLMSFMTGLLFVLGWKVFSLPKAPSVDEIYRKINRFYGLSETEVNAVMGEPEGVERMGADPMYFWNIFPDNSSYRFYCMYHHDRCMASMYLEMHKGTKHYEVRYNEILQALTEKFGTSVRDSRGIASWYKGDQKLGINHMFFKDRELGVVSIVLFNKNFKVPLGK